MPDEKTQRTESRQDKEVGRLRLQQALDQLRESHEETLSFFDFNSSDLSDWQANRCPIDRVPERTKTVENLLEQLDQRRTLTQQQHPPSYQEARKYRTDLDAVEAEISALAKRLDQDFSETVLKPSPTLDSCEKPLPLRSVRDVALLLQEEDSDEHWVSLGWSLLGEKDWAGAYWLAHSLKAAGRDVPVSPELIAVLQGSLWLENGTDILDLDILQIASDWAPQNTTSERLLGLAAALRPSLVAPHTGLVSWLPQKDGINSALGTLADAVRAFALPGYPLRADLGQVIDETVEKARRLLDNKKNRERGRQTLRETKVLDHLTSQEGDLSRLLTPVIERQNDQIDQVRQHLNKFMECGQIVDDKIVESIHQIDQDLTSASPSKPITEIPLVQLVRSVKEAVSLTSRWCCLVEQEIGQENDIHPKGDWWDRHVKEFKNLVQAGLPKVNDELNRMQMQGQSQEEVVVGRVLKRAIGQVTSMLGLEEHPDIENIEKWMKSGSGSLEDALARRLLYIPEIPLDENGHPEEACKANIAEALRQSLVAKRTPYEACIEACILRIESKDFRFTDVLLNALDEEENLRSIIKSIIEDRNDEVLKGAREALALVKLKLQNALDDEDLRSIIEDRNDEVLKGAREALAEEIDKVQGAIEQRVVDGLLTEEERTNLNAELELTAKEDLLPLYFKPLFQRLEDIKEQLERILKDRLQELKSQWKEIKQSLEQNIQADQQREAEQFIQRAFERRDTRVVEEGLARLREVLQGENEWQGAWFAPSDERYVFKDFQDACPNIELGIKGLKNIVQLADVIKKGQTWEGIQFDALPTQHRKEAAKALEAWHELKLVHIPGTDEERAQKRSLHIPDLLEFLGFQVPGGKSSLSVEKYGPDWLYCKVYASVGDLARPIPQLGSQASGCYDVVCFWDLPGTESIVTRLQDLKLDTKTVIIFFLGQLVDQRRHNIAARARERKLSIVVLDEILLVFLARSDDTRLPDFLRCSLPYAALNPYTPFQAGNVPSEMFYGRDRIVRQLQQQNEGSCIVFGGRQLGKSTLLRQVEREFHQPDSERFAWAVDIKLVGDHLTGEQPEQLWIKLRDGFEKHQLITPTVETRAETPEDIIKHIQKAMAEAPQRRVLVLFDEADHFLNADAERNFQVVDGLRTLMQDTQLRFRVVFAGLHGVQRFDAIANHPLSQFGQSVLVGPLEAGPARQLVQEPLETLGYRFADETTVLKVLSYTNYHPGLIQYFCYELVHRLQDKVSSSGPPYEVISDDVEAVYRSFRIRQVIRERLDWTLALDHRYQCIAWAMIHDQKETRDSYVRLFGADDLLKLAREWWPQGFQEVNIEHLQGLLGEMVGLGILMRDLKKGEYLLRSPNLVRLMGTEEDIENRLYELSYKSQPTQSQTNSQHLLLDAGNHQYSPLTLSQEGRLQQVRSSGVSLIFGSQALGLDRIDQALKQGHGREIPAQELTQANLTCEWLCSHTQDQGIEQVLVYGRLNGVKDDMAQCVWQVLELCKDLNHRQKRPLQVVFIFNPEATWSWLKLSEEQRIDRENRANPINLYRCDEVGIHQRLSQAGKLDSPEVCQKVLEATGGWPFLLDELLRRCRDDDDPKSYAEALIKGLYPKSRLGSKLLQQTGLGSQSVPFRVLQTLGKEDEVSVSDADDIEILSTLVEGEPPLSPEDCKMAVEFLDRLGCLKKRNGKYRIESILGRVAGRP